MPHTHRWPGVPLALLSAALFGASTPLAKLLLGSVDPWLLAGLLYLGAGLGLAVVRLGRSAGRASSGGGAAAPRRPAVAGAVVIAGGVLGPLLLMFGLAPDGRRQWPLLLNLEGLATHGHRLGGVPRECRPPAVSGRLRHPRRARRCCPGRAAASGLGCGALLIAGACLAWGIDNNLTRKLSAADPLQIAMTKGLVAGAVNLALACSRAPRLPARPCRWAPAWWAFSAMASAWCCSCWRCGISVLRAPAPISRGAFIGATLAILVLGEP